MCDTPEEAKASLGCLADLEGTWVGDRGWNLIALPAKGSTPDDQGQFRLLLQQYEETITFTPLGDAVKNRGGSDDQFITGLQYDIVVKEKKTGEVIHKENGQWLNLSDIVNNEGEKQAIPEFPFCRLANIPHGNTALLLGTQFDIDGAPDFSNPSALPDAGEGAPDDYLAPYLIEDASELNQFNPMCVDKTLMEDLEQYNVLKTSTFVLDSGNEGGGVLNVPYITEKANTTDFRSVFWMETVEEKSSGDEFQILQYRQTSNMQFHQRFDDEGLINWPHINVNTLRKEE